MISYDRKKPTSVYVTPCCSQYSRTTGCDLLEVAGAACSGTGGARPGSSGRPSRSRRAVPPRMLRDVRTWRRRKSTFSPGGTIGMPLWFGANEPPSRTRRRPSARRRTRRPCRAAGGRAAGPRTTPSRTADDRSSTPRCGTLPARRARGCPRRAGSGPRASAAGRRTSPGCGRTSHASRVRLVDDVGRERDDAGRDVRVRAHAGWGWRGAGCACAPPA